jgi:hypothetical protein
MINLKKYITTKHITFLIDIDKSINVDKTGKYLYFKSSNIENDNISNFITNLDNDGIYLVNPLISVNCKYNDPYLTLSRQFLISNESNSVLIYNYLFQQMEIAVNSFNFELDSYFLLFKYKKVELERKTII